MDCVNCGAPLPVKSDVCGFCGTLNDVDLRALAMRASLLGPQTNRYCPHCDVRLNSIRIAAQTPLHIERCERCLGMFFDPKELDVLVDEAVSEVYEIDHARLTTLIEEQARTPTAPVTYLKCPQCREIMNRKSYGRYAGVVIDTCRAHGVWLDGGELQTILKWVHAGGLLHTAQREEEDRKKQEREAKQARLTDSQRRLLTSRNSVMTRDRDMLGFVDFIAHLLR